ncbi:MAG TPA: hypothetical protein VKR30_10535 [Candidatus Limnocylindrales bacterium]|nr:hypothetical protein [Candidatus Limnocylindrales bacterium]
MRRAVMSLVVGLVLILPATPIGTRAAADDLGGTPSDASSAGVTTYISPTVTSLPDGATQTTYSMPDGEVMTSVTPPAGFDPLTAGADQLAEFGFPPKPSDSVDSSDWTDAMAAYRSDPAPTGPMKFVSGPADSSDFTTYYDVWGGWVAGTVGGTSRTYVAIKSVYYVPTITPPTGLHCGDPFNTQPLGAGFWVGLGGTLGTGLVQQGIECGDPNVASGSAIRPFTEFAGPGGAHAKVFCSQSSWTFNANDKIYQNMSYEVSNRLGNFYLEDETTGVTHSCSLTPPSGWSYNLATADWEAEGPNFQSIQFSTLAFSDANAELNSNSTWVTLGSQSPSKFVDGTDGTSGDYCIAPGAYGTTSFSDYWYQVPCY